MPLVRASLFYRALQPPSARRGRQRLAGEHAVDPGAERQRSRSVGEGAGRRAPGRNLFRPEEVDPPYIEPTNEGGITTWMQDPLRVRGDLACSTMKVWTIRRSHGLKPVRYDLDGWRLPFGFRQRGHAGLAAPGAAELFVPVISHGHGGAPSASAATPH